MATKKITLNELRSIVKQIIKEENEFHPGTTIPKSSIGGVYLLFNKNNGTLETIMKTRDGKEDNNLKKTIENVGQFILHWTSNSNFSQSNSLDKYKGKTMPELGLK